MQVDEGEDFMIDRLDVGAGFNGERAFWFDEDPTIGIALTDIVLRRPDRPEPPAPVCDGTPGMEDTCLWAADGTCDDGGPGATYAGCELGTDCTDCGPRDLDLPPPDFICDDTLGRSNSCEFAANGVCDDGGSGSLVALCEYGSDCFDCGPRDMWAPGDASPDLGIPGPEPDASPDMGPDIGSDTEPEPDATTVDATPDMGLDAGSSDSGRRPGPSNPEPDAIHEKRRAR